VSHDVPVWRLLPYPAFAKPIQNEFGAFDPNLGWYPATYMFGRPRRELPPKEPGEVRLFLLGGSTVWGMGATREDETIAKRLEVDLSSPQAKALLGGTVHVYNEGVSGYYSKQELILLITKIIPFEQPDLVVDLDGLNDFVVYSTQKPQIHRLYSDVWHWHEAELAQSIDQVTTPVGAITNAVIWTTIGVMRSTFFGNFLDQLSHLGSRSGIGLMPRVLGVTRPGAFAARVPQKDNTYFLDNVAMMKSICDGAKVQFFWFPQPVLFLKQKKTAEEEAIYRAADQRESNFWPSLRAFYETTIGHDAVVRFGKAPFFHDISDSLNALESTAYVDTFHYSPAAQAVIAQRIAEAILNPNEPGPKAP